MAQNPKRIFQKTKIPKPKRLTFELPKGTVDLEIGAGTGDFALAYAKQNPSRTLLSVEHTHERFRKFKNKWNQNKPDNLIPIHANAIGFTVHYLPPECLSRIFILYPNPYPKPSQQNNRWPNMPFMEFLIERLEPKGTLVLATNLDDYADLAKQRYIHTWNLDLVEEKALNQTSKELPLTLFEKKYRERGETCFHLTFQKK